MTARIYLAGPEVFLREAAQLYEAKKQICQQFGFEALSPLDDLPAFETMPKVEAGLSISAANETKMKACDLLIANITPFRSPSADVGTAYELGFMRALGKPVLAYANVDKNFHHRTIEFLDGRVTPRDETGLMEDHTGMLLEDFDLVDNLMLDGAVLASGAQVILVDAEAENRFTDLNGFRQCVEMAAKLQG